MHDRSPLHGYKVGSAPIGYTENDRVSACNNGLQNRRALTCKICSDLRATFISLASNFILEDLLKRHRRVPHCPSYPLPPETREPSYGVSCYHHPGFTSRYHIPAVSSRQKGNAAAAGSGEEKQQSRILSVNFRLLGTVYIPRTYQRGGAVIITRRTNI